MIGRTLGSYRILEQVGLGGMATVYKAYDPATDRHVAVKVLPEYYSDNPQFRARFEREARAIARLEHPHILPIHAFGDDEDTVYLVMRYLPGGTLKDRIERGPMPFAEVGTILTQVADALDYAHEHHILHRDVKPSNILLDDKGNVYLSDFGIAKMVEATVDLTAGALLGTPQYMSPEQCQGSTNLSSATDQYSLGVVLYEMLTGRTPFQAETPLALIHMHVSDPLPLPRSLRADLPELAETVLLKALAKNPKDRWPSCSALATALNRALLGAAVPTGPQALTVDQIPAPRPAARRFPAWALGLIGVVVVAVVAAGLVISGMFAGKGAPTKQAAETLSLPAMSEQTRPPALTVAPAITLSPVEQGETVEVCGGDICIHSRSDVRNVGLWPTYIIHTVSWSPDGSKILFAGCPGAGPTGPQICAQQNINLYTANRDGSGVKQVAAPNSVYPAWSPDGDWIAYHNWGDLKIARLDGSAVSTVKVSLTEHGCPEGVAWSPDSQRVAWLGGDCQSLTTVAVVNRDGSAMHGIYKAGDASLSPGMIAWSPDGKSVVVMLDTAQVVQINPDCDKQPTGCDESSRTKLDNFPVHWLNSFYPQWAGEFGGSTPVAAPGPAPVPAAGETLVVCGNDVCVQTADGGQTPLHFANKYKYFMGLSWSPDGKRIAFGGCTLDDTTTYPGTGCYTNLFIIDRDGTNDVALMVNHTLHEKSPAWSPDGQWIAFENSCELNKIKPDKSDYKVLVQRDSAACPEAIAWTPDSKRIAWVGKNQTSNQPDSVWVINADGTDARRIFVSSVFPLEGRIGWSPDGTAVAFSVTDGSIYQIDANCTPGPLGCDQQSLTSLANFPIHWLPDFFPQWAGENVAH